jgi:hypothetical protein
MADVEKPGRGALTGVYRPAEFGELRSEWDCARRHRGDHRLARQRRRPSRRLREQRSLVRSTTLSGCPSPHRRCKMSRRSRSTGRPIVVLSRNAAIPQLRRALLRRARFGACRARSFSNPGTIRSDAPRRGGSRTRAPWSRGAPWFRSGRPAPRAARSCPAPDRSGSTPRRWLAHRRHVLIAASTTRSGGAVGDRRPAR